MADDFDSRLREEAMLWLAARTHDGADFISSADLMDFHFEGQIFRLLDAQRGIRKPRQLSSALSIRTVYTPDGRVRPYEDAVGSDGLLRYKWRGDDPDHAENRALRAAWRAGRGQRLMSLPAIKAERPNPALLEQRYERFCAAS